VINLTIHDQYTDLPLTRGQKYKLRYPERYREHSNYNKEWHRKFPNYDKEHGKEQRLMLLILIGDTCLFCGSTKDIHFHNIFNKNHQRDYYYYIKHIKDFRPLCESCHHSYHKNTYVVKWLIA
jgi:hypothetical protein